MKDEVLNKLVSEWKRLKIDFDSKYGCGYPKQSDNKGWRNLGRIEGLAYLIMTLDEK